MKIRFTYDDETYDGIKEIAIDVHEEMRTDQMFAVFARALFLLGYTTNSIKDAIDNFDTEYFEDDCDDK